MTTNVAIALEELNKIKDSLQYFEDALWIAHKLFLKGVEVSKREYLSKAGECLGKAIDNIGEVFSRIDLEDKELALTYAEHVLDLRRANDYGLNTSVLLPIALNRCAGIGVNMNDAGSIRKALLYMNEALQLSLNGLHCRDYMRESHSIQAALAFNNIGFAHGRFNDTKKSIEYYMQCYSLIKQYHVNTNIPLCASLEDIFKQHAPSFLPSQQLRKIIFKVGQVTLPLLEIKSIIQVKALNQIQELAANGEWSKGKFFEKGVKSYLEDSFLTKLLGSEYNNQANLTIAKMLCFEAINIGIMSRHPDNNYICLVQYQKEFPDLFLQILSEHPEYFVDGSLLLLMEDDPNILQELLDNKKLSCVDDVADMALLYLNKMTQQIKEIAKDTLEKIEELSSNEKWNAHLLRKGVVDLIQEKNLISILGNNLNQPDNIEMAKMLCFEAINKGAVSSKKYTCTKLFIQDNFELVVKVAAIYPQYFINKDVIETCFNSSDEKEQIYNEMKEYLNCHQDDSFCKEILGDLVV